MAGEESFTSGVQNGAPWWVNYSGPLNLEQVIDSRWSDVFYSLEKFFTNPMKHVRVNAEALGIPQLDTLSFSIDSSQKAIGNTGLTIEKFRIDKSMKTILRFEPNVELKSAEYGTDEAPPTYSLTIEYVDGDGSMVIRYFHGRRDPQNIPLGKATVKIDSKNKTIAFINANDYENRDPRLPTQDEMNILLLEAEDVLRRLAFVN